ncbi:hypothetical protein HD806DRAFT_532814 [Xylariaceae sp. AK1471]|nr:hypothetical protein HD806DRAFT_532814 [Xylariaceae sp. AK1471]
MPEASIPPSPTLTANDELGEIHQPSTMLELYLSEEPTLPERLLMTSGGDVHNERLDAARKHISTFEQQWSK